jgi:hypothetical protein
VGNEARSRKWVKKYPPQVKQDLIFAYATGVWSTLIFAFIVHINSPKAIDVYRGKTTLKITYVNKVATDSTVVYK